MGYTDSFPYGNDINNPDSWAGLATTKSRTWIAAYHSGISFFFGKHTILFFGKENLVAFKAHITGSGPQVSWGIKIPANKLARSTGMSKELRQRIENKLEVVELHEKTAQNNKNTKELENLNSAKGIYNAIGEFSATIESEIPFCANDMNSLFGVILGVEVNVAIGSASGYIIDAMPYFQNVSVANIKKEASTVSASLGELVGFWEVGEIYSLWDELSNSDTEEYPFRSYNVHPAFHQYKNPKIALLIQEKKHTIIDQAALSRIKFLTKESNGALHNLRIINETKSLSDNFHLMVYEGKNVMEHPLMAFVPYNIRYMFVSK